MSKEGHGMTGAEKVAQRNITPGDISPTPWRYTPADKYDHAIIRNDHSDRVATDDGRPHHKPDKDFPYAAACVNACAEAGLDTTALEAGVVKRMAIAMKALSERPLFRLEESVLSHEIRKILALLERKDASDGA